MISEISVYQFALIEQAQFELHAGMTVFSGETGAGKSMLLDAMSALFGSRANVNWVRHGA
ncbi:MAG: ATP-binding protein, partial [Mariprofundaceae bacterium]|nr:ATP-binding protein [Mariprofundaceae bacterium]